MRADQATHFRRSAGVLLVLSALLLLGGCEEETADVLRELDEARDGCTREQLREGSEECVAMFERYAEMGVDAVETYIGALRALDEALQRRGPELFDTAGLGRAITPGAVPGAEADSLDDPFFAPGARWGPVDGQPFAPSERRWPEGGTPGSGASGLGGPGEDWGAAPRGPVEERGARRDRPGAEPPSTHDPPARPTRRGILLPPEERLRRPWLDEAPHPEDAGRERHPPARDDALPAVPDYRDPASGPYD